MRRGKSNHSIDQSEDFFARWKAQPLFWFIGVRILLVAIAVMIVAGSTACFRSSPEVIIYAAQDQQFAEPILKDFQKQTGIKVRAVYDSEAVKTVALANRLLAEAGHPRCDVWWSNEALRTRQLAARGVF
jgi:iron(III) transport system substrate-binding protein